MIMRVMQMKIALAVLGLFAATATAQETMILEFYELDHLGNVLVVTDANGNVVEEHDYDPYGQELCGTPPNMVPCATMPAGQNRRFTGKERDKETGLDYFGARYYQANLGRFTSVDPVMDVKTALRNPQKWNRYAYGRNNPLTYVDPDGRDEYTARMAMQISLSMMGPRQRAVAEAAQSASDRGTMLGSVAVLGATGVAMAPAIATELSIAGGRCMASAGCQNAVRGVAEDLSGAAPGSMGTVGASFTAKTGWKVGQQLARWREAGNVGGVTDFIKYAERLADEAAAAGQVVSGTVGTGRQALEGASIYRRGGEYLVVQGNRVMSYVANAKPGGVADEFVRLGGKK